jgi:hypothetical protein
MCMPMWHVLLQPIWWLTCAGEKAVPGRGVEVRMTARSQAVGTVVDDLVQLGVVARLVPVVVRVPHANVELAQYTSTDLAKPPCGASMQAAAV